MLINSKKKSFFFIEFFFLKVRRNIYIYIFKKNEKNENPRGSQNYIKQNLFFFF
jgi:hypothetical protein